MPKLGTNKLQSKKKPKATKNVITLCIQIMATGEKSWTDNAIMSVERDLMFMLGVSAEKYVSERPRR